MPFGFASEVFVIISSTVVEGTPLTLSIAVGFDSLLCILVDPVSLGLPPLQLPRSFLAVCFPT